MNYSVARFYPRTNRIIIRTDFIRTRVRCWRRFVIAAYIHELMHKADWYFIHRRNAKSWDSMTDERAEYWPCKIEVFVLRLLFVGARVVNYGIVLDRGEIIGSAKHPRHRGKG